MKNEIVQSKFDVTVHGRITYTIQAVNSSEAIRNAEKIFRQCNPFGAKLDMATASNLSYPRESQQTERKG